MALKPMCTALEPGKHAEPSSMHTVMVGWGNYGETLIEIGGSRGRTMIAAHLSAVAAQLVSMLLRGKITRGVKVNSRLSFAREERRFLIVTASWSVGEF
jgi:hypothetical protein